MVKRSRKVSNKHSRRKSSIKHSSKKTKKVIRRKIKRSRKLAKKRTPSKPKSKSKSKSQKKSKHPLNRKRKTHKTTIKRGGLYPGNRVDIKSHKEAEQVLYGEPRGTFIIRTPSDKLLKKDVHKVMSIVNTKNNRQLLHIAIKKKQNNKVYLPTKLYKNIMFNTVLNLVTYFKRYGLELHINNRQNIKFKSLKPLVSSPTTTDSYDTGIYAVPGEPVFNNNTDAAASAAASAATDAQVAATRATYEAAKAANAAASTSTASSTKTVNNTIPNFGSVFISKIAQPLNNPGYLNFTKNDKIIKTGEHGIHFIGYLENDTSKTQRLFDPTSVEMQDPV